METPPLRERREDIPILAAHFIQKYAGDNRVEAKIFTAEAMDYLSGYEWPGNVRQLENVIERCMVLASGESITVEDLPPELRDEDTPVQERRGPAARAAGLGRHPGAHRGRPDTPRPGAQRVRAGQGRGAVGRVQESAPV